MPAELLMSQADIDARPDEWLDRRREGLTASEMAAVVGLAPPRWGSAFDLYHAKLEGWVTEQTEQMAWGHFAEPWVAERFADQYPHLHISEGGLYRSSTHHWLMATYDRLAYESGAEGDLQGDTALGPVQIKTQGFLDDDWGEPGSATIPVHYRVQVLIEMAVGDYAMAWLPVMDNNHKVITYEIPRDAEAEADIEYLIGAGEEFLDRLRLHREPPVDWTPATAKALKRLHPVLEEREVEIPITLARRYKRAIAAEKAAAQRKALAVNQIMARMAGAKYAVVAGLTGPKGQPVKLATRSMYDQAETIVKAHPVDKITPSRWMP